MFINLFILVSFFIRISGKECEYTLYTLGNFQMGISKLLLESKMTSVIKAHISDFISVNV